MTKRVIVLIGATGTFGQRLARLIAQVDGVELIVTSRSKHNAEALAQVILAASPGACITAVALDTRGDIESQLTSLAPFLVIDTSGPFQGANFRTAEAALKSGAHWIDIADARDYLLGFGAALENLARSEALSAFAGASTSPALSTAVVAGLTRDWRRIDTIDIAVRPGGATGLGSAVIEAVLTYAGLPIEAWIEGRMRSVTGWGWPKRVAVPELGLCYVSAVETADARLMAERFSVSSRVVFRFGLQSRLEHFGLVLLGWFRRHAGLGSLMPLAPWLQKAHGVMTHIGGGTGGMLVEASGLNADGRAVSARWWLVARQGHGPNVPILAAMALTRKLLAGGVASGALPAHQALSLDDIVAEMRPFDIDVGESSSPGPGLGLFERALGAGAYAALAPAVRAFHDADAAPVWCGEADVEAGTTLPARLLARVFGFPPTARATSVTVSVQRDATSETWIRNFSGRRFSSRLSQGHGGVSEHFGPFTMQLALTGQNRGLQMPVAGWRLGPCPLPRWLAPKSEAREFQDEDGRFRFDVRISAPLVGLIAHYRGWLIANSGDFKAFPTQDNRFAAKRPDLAGEVSCDSGPVHAGAANTVANTVDCAP